MKRIIGNIYWDWYARHTQHLSIAIASYDAHTATVILDKTSSYQRIFKGLFLKTTEAPPKTYAAYWGPDSFHNLDITKLG